MAAYDGVVSELYWTASGGGSPTKISGPSNQINTDESSNEIEAPYRDNPTFAIAGTPDRSISMDYLDQVGGTDMDDLELADTGTLDFYPEGNSTGKRKWTATAVVVGRPFESPLNDAVSGTMNWRYTSAITRSVVA